LAGWRAIFFYEGVPSVILGILTWFILPDFPQTTYFFTPKERLVAVHRLLQEGTDPTDDSVKMSEALSALTDIKVWCYMLMYIGIHIPNAGYTFFLPTIIKNMGYSSMQVRI
jgi:predicted MFS family arabinose efflux permease